MRLKKFNPEYESYQSRKLQIEVGTPALRKKRMRKLNRRMKLYKQAKLGTNRNPIRNYYLYALVLEDGFYYVGLTSTKDALARYQAHKDGKGAKWTRLHKPLELKEVRTIGVCTQATAVEAENLMTREYMSKYGLYKVRGGDLCYKNDTLIALHFNDSRKKKNTIYDSNGRRIKKSRAATRRVEKIQEQIADELSWII